MSTAVQAEKMPKAQLANVIPIVIALIALASLPFQPVSPVLSGLMGLALWLGYRPLSKLQRTMMFICFAVSLTGFAIALSLLWAGTTTITTVIPG